MLYGTPSSIEMSTHPFPARYATRIAFSVSAFRLSSSSEDSGSGSTFHCLE